MLGQPAGHPEVDPGLDGGGEEGKGKASDPEPVWNKLQEVHAEEGSVHLAGDMEDEGRKGEWVEGAICGVEQSEEGSEAVGG